MRYRVDGGKIRSLGIRDRVNAHKQTHTVYEKTRFPKNPAKRAARPPRSKVTALLAGCQLYFRRVAVPMSLLYKLSIPYVYEYEPYS